MSSESENEIAGLIAEIRGEFPEVASHMDKWLEYQGYTQEDKAYYAEMEAFSQATTDAIKGKNEAKAREYLRFMADKLKTATPVQHEYIDVYYVESLLGDIRDPKLKRWGWSLIPENLKRLYIQMWGEP